MEPVRFGETTPLGVCRYRPRPRAAQALAPSESFVTRLGRLVATTHRHIIGDCFWSTARLHTSCQWRWRPAEALRYCRKLCTPKDDSTSCGVQPMVRLFYMPGSRDKLADAWRAAVGRADLNNNVHASWRTDVAALLDWIDEDPRGMPMLLGNASGLVLVDGPTAVVGEIVWAHSRSHNVTTICVDLADLCRALECKTKETTRHREMVTTVVLYGALLLLLFVAGAVVVAPRVLKFAAQ
nr:hypothetical protein [Pandoravirus aubagnensis]